MKVNVLCYARSPWSELMDAVDAVYDCFDDNEEEMVPEDDMEGFIKRNISRIDHFLCRGIVDSKDDFDDENSFLEFVLRRMSEEGWHGWKMSLFLAHLV